MSSQTKQVDVKRSLRSSTKPSDYSEDSIFEKWSDVSHDDLPPNAIISIDFSVQYLSIFSLLAAARRRAERSERCMDLAHAAISINAADVSAWEFLQETAEELAKMRGTLIWERELAFTASVILENPKNYQAWGYRRHIAKELKTFESEVMFVEVVLSSDEKNYHAWAHRQWLVREGYVDQGELEAVEWYLEDDVRNNSAWNHAWLVVKDLDLEMRMERLNWAIDMLKKSARNESAWNFIHALGKSGVDIRGAMVFAEYALHKDARNVAARRFLVLNATEKDREYVMRHCAILVEVDPVRKKYWNMQLEHAKKLVILGQQ